MSATPINSSWTIVCRRLEQELQRVREEIRSYPAPIPACDAQFNYLLEQREALSSELARARARMSEDRGSVDVRRSVDAFLSSSGHIGASLKRDVRALVENEYRRGECEE